MSKTKFILSVIGVFILVLGLDVFGVFWSSVIRPYREDVKREVFENTRAFREGARQELMKYRMQYLQGDELDKDIIAQTVQMRYANIELDENDHPELHQFINECINRRRK